MFKFFFANIIYLDNSSSMSSNTRPQICAFLSDRSSYLRTFHFSFVGYNNTSIICNKDDKLELAKKEKRAKEIKY
jgi:hypothetical protein